jgi:Autotransporter beta-domain
MRTPLLAGALAALLAPAAPRAATPPVTLGARIGYAAAAGDAAKGVEMRELTIASQVPVQLDATVRVWRDLEAGAYLSYGFGQADRRALFGACEAAGVSCSGRSWRLGAQAVWSFRGQLAAPVVPWAGLGLGWEWASIEGKDPTGTSTVSVNGLELALQAGAGYRVNAQLSVGPYLSLSLGRYRAGEVKVGGATLASGGVVDKTFHEWLGAGVAGRFDL